MSQSPIFSLETIHAMIGAKMYNYGRTDSKVVAESRMLSAQYAVSVMTLSQRLLAKLGEADRLNHQLSEL